MLKKVIFWMIIVGLSAGLVAGAINRTNAKSKQDEAARSYAHGLGNTRQTISGDEPQPGIRRGQDEAGKRDVAGTVDPLVTASRGNGNGQNRGIQNSEDSITMMKDVFPYTEESWFSFDASVILVDDEALTLQFSDGEQVAIEGRAWRYALESGFTTSIGHQIIATGFLEDGEFKVGTLENSTSGQTIVLREASGRPLWSGWGRRVG